MKPRAGSKALIREINEALVLDVVRAQGPVARAGIATATGLSAATVTGITGKLLESGLLVESDVVRATRGRPARLLDLGTEAVLAAGVRLSATEAHAVLTTLRGEVIAQHQEPLASVAAADAVEALVRAVRTVAGQRPAAALVGVGVAVSGIVDHRAGVVRHSGALDWEEVPLQALLAEELGVPVVIDSYVNCIALALPLLDTGLEGRDLLVFSVGTSLGASVVVGGRIHRGFNGSAGGFAHARLGVRGRALPCHCGASGCLETRASGWGLRRELERDGEQPRPFDADRDRELLERAGEVLGTAVANAAKMFGPERVALAFTQDMSLPPLLVSAREAFHAQYLHENTAPPALELTTAKSPLLARGAAHSALSRTFTTAVPETADSTRAALTTR
ncbi:ROK family protein [Streptomyces sp. NA04227]|uniref:ROK family protein n=1 Tax=Streptomyces sp. NA04227 TaxID=2742136 RepID=UPI0015926CCE|nr:ROK family protein [Streptomyces sp. NA04227]QKW10305.1 ROK family protein [Streptomyces sp. NA04227]